MLNLFKKSEKKEKLVEGAISYISDKNGEKYMHINGVISLLKSYKSINDDENVNMFIDQMIVEFKKPL